MNLFYVRHIEGNIVQLGEEEARHCVNVLRHRVGDQIDLVDGKGGYYHTVILETGKKKCVVEVKEETQNYQQKPYWLHVGIAPTKNIARMEWFLEKATEIGIDSITPLLCKHSERKQLRMDRLEKVLVAAMKQSAQAYLPRLNPVSTFKEFMAQNEPEVQQRYIAHCQEGVKALINNNYQPKESVSILIGPEGDFSKKEIALAEQNNYQSITLGPHRMRTETAGIVACHTISFLNEIAT